MFPSSALGRLATLGPSRELRHASSCRLSLCVPYHRLRFPGGPPCAAVLCAVSPCWNYPWPPFSLFPSRCTTDPYAIDPPGHLQLFPLAHLNHGRPCNTRPRLAADPHQGLEAKTFHDGGDVAVARHNARSTTNPSARFALIRASRCSNRPRQLPLNVSRILGTGENLPQAKPLIRLVGTVFAPCYFWDSCCSAYQASSPSLLRSAATPDYAVSLHQPHRSVMPRIKNVFPCGGTLAYIGQSRPVREASPKHHCC